MKTDIKSIKSSVELITRYLSGNITDDEAVMLHKWVNESEENKQLYFRIRNTWQASSQAAPEGVFDTMRALEKVNQKIRYSQSTGNNPSAPIHFNKKIMHLGGILKIAALWILLISIGAITSLVFIKNSGYRVQSSTVSFMAPMGSKAQASLPDGTKVWLNAGSTLEYYIKAESKIREVKLTGEAYFEVTKNPARPFCVNAGEITVRAYGTKFNVKAYPEEGVIETTLVEGSVSVEVKNKTDEKIMLKPNEQVFYYKATSEKGETLVVSKGIDPELYTLWIDNRLQINGETLASLAVMLERKYDVTIYFDDPSLKDLRFTGFIEKETIEQVLELLKISSSINYRIKGREIWLLKSK